MNSQSSVPTAKSAAPLVNLRVGLTFVAYGLLVLAAILSIPLRIPEVLQIAAVRDFSPPAFFSWIAQAPGSSPLNPILQSPFLLAGGHTRFAARFISLVFALAASFLFLRLARRVPLERPYWALLLFMLLPVHFELSYDARPFEQALFCVVLSAACFFRLVSRPTVRSASFYAASLLLCLYTDRYAFLPAIGYLLFLLRFADRAGERRALWHALAATAAPALLFLPYALWAHLHVSPDWFSASPLLATPAIYLRALRSVAEERWAAYILSVFLAIGILTGASTSFRPDGGAIGKRIRLFVLAGGVLATIIAAFALDLSLNERFAPSHLLWAAPGAVILTFAAIEWLAKRPGFQPLGIATTILLVAICATADAAYLLSRPSQEDLQALAAAIPAQMNGDSCVVFVSEKFSRILFLTFEPGLDHRECIDFFNSRIVLASHPYVTPEQQQDAESFLRGLNFTEVKRVSAGGGQLVVMQQQAE